MIQLLKKAPLAALIFLVFGALALKAQDAYASTGVRAPVIQQLECYAAKLNQGLAFCIRLDQPAPNNCKGGCNSARILSSTFAKRRSAIGKKIAPYIDHPLVAERLARQYQDVTAKRFWRTHPSFLVMGDYKSALARTSRQLN